MSFPLVSLTDTGPFSADYLGGKGFNLWRMAQAGYPVPPAIIIPTEVCRAYMKDPAAVEFWLQTAGVKAIEEGLIAAMGYLPLVSVRSGARQSMPGMMDTILNVGLDSKTMQTWEVKLGAVCAVNSYARLNKMFKEVVGESLPNAAPAQLYLSILAVFRSWNNERAVTYRNMHNIPHDGGTAVTIQA